MIAPRKPTQAAYSHGTTSTMRSSTPPSQILALLLNDWHELLQCWSASGDLVAAAREALQLSTSPAALSELVEQWAAGNFDALPPIVPLPSVAMAGAVGAYALSTGTIYLNTEWLQGSSSTQVLKALTEELGHHLDGLLNNSDTPGDEGELFAALLTGKGQVNGVDRERILNDRDEGEITVDLNGGSSNDLEQGLRLGAEFSRAQYFQPTPGLGVDSIADSDVFLLESNPGSKITLNLRFGGYDLRDTSWSAGGQKDYDPMDSIPVFSLDGQVDTNYSAAELRAIKEIFLRVAADYAPFDVNVTTKYQQGVNPYALSGPTDRFNDDIKLTGIEDEKYGISAVIGNTHGKLKNAAGITSMAGAIRMPEELPRLTSGAPIIPTWVPIVGPVAKFIQESIGVVQELALPLGSYMKPILIATENCNGSKEIAETISHELGHALGLNHDGINLQSPPINNEPEYYNGRGSSPGWAPIMGSGNESITQFSRGEYEGATNKENDFEIFTHAGVGRFLDDNTVSPADPFSAATAATEIYFGRDDVGYAFGEINLMSADGLAPTDEDWFSFTAIRNGKVQIRATNAQAFSVIGKGDRFVNLPSGYGNLHLDVQLYTDQGNTLVADWNLNNEQDVSNLLADVVAGRNYWIKVLPNANLPDRSIGETTWGSLGGYLLRLENRISFEDDHLQGPTREDSTIYDRTIPEQSSGTIEYKSDRDWFSLYLLKDIPYEIRLDVLVSPDKPILSPSLVLRNASSVPLVDSYSEFSSHVSIQYTPTEFGWYVADVGAFAAGSTGSYKISVKQLDDVAGDLSTNRNLSWYGVEGEIDENNLFLLTQDQDWYQTYLDAGNTYIFRMNRVDDSPLHSLLRIRDSAGTILAKDDSNAFKLGDALIVFTPTVSGQYFVDATVSKGSSGGRYQLTRQFDYPSISLEVTPSSATEEGPSLIYTFTRDGDLAAAKTVYYSLGGSATSGTDYTGISASGSAKKTAIFEAGKSTVAIQVIPLTDLETEGEETVTLTLLEDNGYQIATTNPVTGTIADVDLRNARVVKSPISVAYPGRTSGEVRNSRAFAVLKANGSVVTWGDASYGGDSSGVAVTLSSGVRQIFSTSSAFAALKADGSVVAWGLSGGDIFKVKDKLQSGVTSIYSNDSAFAALKADGSIVTWGSSIHGGDSSGVASRLSSGVTKIFSASGSFGGSFAALKDDGSVVTWGNSGYGGESSTIASSLSFGIRSISSSERAYAAVKGDGSVVTWGNPSYGADSSGVASKLSSDVVQIFATRSAFAALKADGSVVAWGDSLYGGDSYWVRDSLKSGVSQIVSTDNSFSALKSDGSVVTWGLSVAAGIPISSGVTQIISNSWAFAALKADGSVVTWGDASYGGNSNTKATSLASGVTQIFATDRAFAALKADGSVVTWGDASYGGDSNAKAASLASGVTQIFATGGAFAALKSDGSIVSWGATSYGGDSSGVNDRISSSVVAFADPFTNDRLVFDPAPVITLAVSPASVTEDGSANLIYTFTRTGDTSSALTINYTVGGTATLGTDYTGIAATPATKTVTFAAGATTTTVIVDPTADTAIESNETVALTLAAGTGYSIGTTGAVTATISNDDTPVITLALSPAAVTEDGTSNLIYTFSRTGATTAALSVNYTVAGTATLGSDYTGISTTGTTKTVTFAAGSTGVTVTVDPRAESTVEDDETVELTLAPGDGYTIGTTAAVIGTISNDDTTDISSMSILGSFNGNSSAAALAGRLKTIDSSTNQGTSVNGDSSIKALAQLTAATPLKTTAKSLLDRYVIHDPDSGTKRKASADDAGFLDFTLKTGSLKSLTAEIQLASEVKATAYVKVNPNTGDAYDFTYDPVTGLGAELLDTNKNGLVDTLRIHLQDGAKGDADGLVNGEIRDPGVLAEAPRAPVYRFYRNGVHFYTTSDTERDNVIKNSYASGIAYADLSTNPQSKDPITGGWGYRFEGVAYQALETQGTALYRFFSPSKGYHFVTTNTTEALNVIKNSVGSSYDLTNAQGQQLLDNGWGYQFEGNTYKVSSIAQTGMDQPVYRFFNGIKGVHFYSSSMAEAKSVIANSLGDQYATDSWVTSTADALKQNPLTSTPAPLATGWGYSFEGIAWYV
jgi:alpha-tubulin suppressor-like RCC1 family protein